MSNKRRLDQLMVSIGLVPTRSQAESYIKLGKVKLDDRVITKPGQLVEEKKATNIKLDASEQYVSRAALKLASVTEALKIDFKDKVILDVGSSTGGFSDYALRSGAKKVIAVEKGTNQLHPSLVLHKNLELHEKTDIRDFKPNVPIDIVLIDVSFVSLREILPYLTNLISDQTQIIAMAKPQFEAVNSSLKHKGVIKNDHLRRQILKDLEQWLKQHFVIQDKADSLVSGAKGNQERFYLLKKVS